LLAKLPAVPETEARTVLNRYYLTDDGFSNLRERLRTGLYDVGVPEEGALLVVAWLVENGYVEEARGLLEGLGSYFPTMRFYPVPRARAQRFGSQVFLQDVGRTIDDLRKIKTNSRILAQKEAIEVWARLYERLVQLFFKTVEGEAPSLEVDEDGRPVPL